MTLTDVARRLSQENDPVENDDSTPGKRVVKEGLSILTDGGEERANNNYFAIDVDGQTDWHEAAMREGMIMTTRA